MPVAGGNAAKHHQQNVYVEVAASFRCSCTRRQCRCTVQATTNMNLVDMAKYRQPPLPMLPDTALLSAVTASAG
jgi:hypothetical protein